MNKLDFQYYRLEEKHLKDVQYLFLHVFNKKVSPEYLRKKYDTRYLGLAPVAYIAYHDEQVVAFYGAIPQKFVQNGKTFIAAHACDSFTLEAYQRMGLHFELATRSYEVMKAEGIRFVYAFHSENTFHSTKKLNWKCRENMRRFHFVVPTLPFAKVVSKLGLTEWYHSVVSKFLRSKVVSNFSCKTFQTGQVYDDSFLAYKNGFGKHSLLRLHDCEFLIKIESILKVGYFNFPDEAKLKSALSSLKSICKVFGINEIQFHVSENTEMFRALSKLEEAKLSWKIGYLEFEELEFSEFEFCYADLDTY
jgi:GNAT superfamily N-acetyltransferase